MLVAKLEEGGSLTVELPAPRSEGHEASISQWMDFSFIKCILNVLSIFNRHLSKSSPAPAQCLACLCFPDRLPLVAPGLSFSIKVASSCSSQLVMCLIKRPPLRSLTATPWLGTGALGHPTDAENYETKELKLSPA